MFAEDAELRRGDASTSVKGLHSFTPRQTAKLKRSTHPALANILHPLRSLGESDIELLQTQTLASLSAQLQDDRQVQRGNRVAAETIAAETAVDGIMKSFTPLHQVSAEPIRPSQSAKLPPLPAIFPETGLKFSDVIEGRDRGSMKHILASSLNQLGVPHVSVGQNPVLAWYRGEMRDFGCQVDIPVDFVSGSRPLTPQDPASPAGRKSITYALPARPPSRDPTQSDAWQPPHMRRRERKLSEFVRQMRSPSSSRPSTAEHSSRPGTSPIAASNPSQRHFSSQHSPRHSRLQSESGSFRRQGGPGTPPGTAAEDAAAEGAADASRPATSHLGAGEVAGGEGAGAAEGAVRAPVVAWRSGRSEVNEQAKRGRREEGELPPQQLAHELLMTQAAFEDKYADMQDELVTSRRRVEQLETELEAVTSLHNAMLKDQYAVAEEMGLRDQVTLGDPLLLMKAREMYETRIAALKAGEESLTKDNRRLKEQRKDLQDDVSRLTKKLNTEVFARDQAIKRLENVRETLKENIDNLKATIDELKHTVDVKEGEKGELKKQLDKKDKDLLTSEMERRALKDALEKQRMATQKAEAEVQQINGQMQDAINDWKKKLDEQMASFQADMQEFMHMKSTYADLQTERKAVQALFESETKVTAQLRHGERMADVRIRALEDTVQEKDREIAILKDHIRELQERAEQDHRVILSLKEVEQENKRLKEKLAEERDTAVRRIEEAKAETRRFEAEVARLARLMDDEKHEAALARADMEDARTAAEKATHKVDELKGMLRATQEELEAASAKASKYESLCAEARGDAHAAQKQVVKLQEETRMLTNKVEELTAALAAVRQELEELRDDHKLLQDQHAQLKEEHAALVQRNKEQLEMLGTERKDLMEHVEALKGKVRQLAPLPEELRHTKEELEAARYALEKLREQHAKLSSEKIDVDRELREIKQVAAILEEEKRDLINERTANEKRIEDLEQQSRDLQSDIEQLEEKANKLEDDLSDLRDRHADLTDRHKALVGKHGDLELKHADAERAHRKYVQEAEEKLAKVTAERDDLREERDYLRSVDGPKNKLIEGLKLKLAKPLEIPEVKKVLDHIRQKLEEETKARLFREKYASTLQEKVKDLERRIKEMAMPGNRHPRHRAIQVTPTDLWDQEMEAVAHDTATHAEAVIALQSRATSPMRFSRPPTQQRALSPPPSPPRTISRLSGVPASDWVLDVLIEAGLEAEAAQALTRGAGTPGGDTARRSSFGLSTPPEQSAGPARMMSAQSVLDIIYEIYKEKVKGDMSVARWGGQPHSLKTFTEQLFHLRYSVRRIALQQLRDFGHNIRRLSYLAPVAKFGLSVGLLRTEDVPDILRDVHKFPRTSVLTQDAGFGIQGHTTTSITGQQRAKSQTMGANVPDMTPGRATSPGSGFPGFAGTSLLSEELRAASADLGSVAASAVLNTPSRGGQRTSSDAFLPPSSPPRRSMADMERALTPSAAGPLGAPPSQFINPYSGLPLPLQWRGLSVVGVSETPRDVATPEGAEGGAEGEGEGRDVAVRDVWVASFFGPRLQPAVAPKHEWLVHPMTLKGCRHLMGLPNAGRMLEYLSSSEFFTEHVQHLDLGVPVTGRQVPQLYQMLSDVALVFHLNPKRLPQIYIRPMRSASCQYLCLPMSMIRNQKKMPAFLKMGLSSDFREGSGIPFLRASEPLSSSPDARDGLSGSPHSPHSPSPSKLAATIGRLRKTESDEQAPGAPAVGAARADDGLAVQGKATGDPVLGRVGAESYHHCIVVSSGLLDLLEPAEVRAALAGALLPFVVHHQLQGRRPEDASGTLPKRGAEHSSSARDSIVLRWLPQLATAATLSEIHPEILASQVNTGISGDSYATLVGPAIASWRRNMALSEDRACLAAAQDVGTVLSLVLKGSTESAALVDELDVNAVMELAEQTDVTKVLEGWAKEPHVQLGAVAHSMAVLRVREIRRWEMSGEYQDMFKGAKPRPFFR